MCAVPGSRPYSPSKLHEEHSSTTLDYCNHTYASISFKWLKKACRERSPSFPCQPAPSSLPTSSKAILPCSPSGDSLSVHKQMHIFFFFYSFRWTNWYNLLLWSHSLSHPSLGIPKTKNNILLRYFDTWWLFSVVTNQSYLPRTEGFPGAPDFHCQNGNSPRQTGTVGHEDMRS